MSSIDTAKPAHSGWTYSSRALILRQSRTLNAFDENLYAWTPDSHAETGIDAFLSLLQERPAWCSGPEYVKACSHDILVQRANLPPSVHFSHGKLATSVYAAVLANEQNPEGRWITLRQLLSEVDDQWMTVLNAVCTQYLNAIASGFMGKSAAMQAETPLNPISAPPLQQNGYPQKPVAGSAQGNSWLSSESLAGGHIRPSPAGCSGYNDEDHAWGVHSNNSEEEESESLQASEDEDQAAAQILSTSSPPVQWQPGAIAVIEEGGRDVQSVLDSEGVKLGIINWHACWIEACLEIQPYMQRLAARFKSVAVMHLDVEHSMANKLLAYEKVLTRSESRRRGAKPILRNYQNFPCLTVHAPCNPLPMQTFCGKDALDQLAAGALLARSKELTEAPVLGTGQGDATKSTASMPVAQDPPGKTDGPGSPSGRPPVPENWVQMKRGAMDLKQHLHQAKQRGTTVAVVWTSGVDGSQFYSFATESPALEFLHADVTVGKDNRTLASSLRVKHYPTVQVYVNLKLVKHVEPKLATKDWRQPLSRVLCTNVSAPLPTEQAQSPLLPTSEEKLPSGPPSNDEATSQAQQAAGNPIDPAKDGQRLLPREGFDPPVQAAKAEQKRRFPSGTGTFWPKMPCLRCGCPWWLGEDWDARCARCRWTAESDGYDDDSKPLPKYKGKYREFTEAIKAGKTPAWQP